MQHGRTARYANRTFTLVYLTILLLVPLGLILYRTFSPGVGAFIDSMSSRRPSRRSTSHCSSWRSWCRSTSCSAS